MSPSTARGLAVLVVCLACARGTAANGVFGARGLDTAETPSTQRGFDVREADADASLPPVNDMSPHALAADAADAAAEALSLPRSTGTRFSAESLSTPPPDQRGAVVVTKPRPASVETFAVRAETATEGSVSPNTPPSSYATLLTLESYLGGSADPPFDADPDAVAAAAAAAQFLEAEKAIARAYDAAMSAWLAAEASLDATAASVDAGVAFQEQETRERGNTSAEEDAYFREKKWAYRHGVGEADDVRFSAGAGGFGESDLEQYAKAACTVSIHHKPVYVPGVFLPPKLAPSVKIPGTPPVFIPGKPAFWEPGRAPFYNPGFWTPGKPPRFISAVRPVIIPAKHGTVVPGEFVPPAYTPGFVIPGWHETSACALPVCVAPCQDAPVIQPDIVY